MPRDIRRTVFLSPEEDQLIQSVTPDDVSIGATIRRLAIKQAQWYAENSKKPRGAPRTTLQPADNTYYDTTDAQE